jgi:CubicO group peptidase (beta-lactamase class C family)
MQIAVEPARIRSTKRIVQTRLPPLLAALVAAFLCVASVQAQDKFAGVPVAEQPFVDKGEISGAVMLVATKDKILHLSAVGQSDLATGRKLETGDLFWIASMSKPITAVCVGLLVDDGKLSFDDPVEKFLPEFRNLWLTQEQAADRRVLVKPPRPVTLRDLLTHTSGLGEYTVTGPHWTLAEMTRTLTREPLRFPPGSRWAYSTAGIDALGRVVEIVSGMPFAEFMQKRLLDALGMTHTSFWLTPEQKKRLATSYVMNPQTSKLESTAIFYMYRGEITDAARPALGGAGLFSTAEDVAKFYQMMLNNGIAGGQPVLKPETLAEMTRKQTGELKARAGMPWGLGFCVVEDPKQMEANATFTPGTFGHGGAFGTQSWADPTRGLVYVFMIQRDKIPNNPDNSPMRRAYQTAVEAALAQ